MRNIMFSGGFKGSFIELNFDCKNSTYICCWVVLGWWICGQVIPFSVSCESVVVYGIFIKRPLIISMHTFIIIFLWCFFCVMVLSTVFVWFFLFLAGVLLLCHVIPPFTYSLEWSSLAYFLLLLLGV